ncbi:hypothetical protein F383_14341 [Gossypium arboreum]|uniref:Uncharacterized protein n=1 Tax=Gossypium arboreum TaxID=29729 RepID=A0A0B0PWZ5_GOSAR|nr:hypothetical protein F383_14341 [Gossypium arboreum]
MIKPSEEYVCIMDLARMGNPLGSEFSLDW